ncbi:MAG: sulfatase, partial [Acidobacteria bacterium]|nr:sulfatase [Acidobacteriota bacterium]
FLFGLTVPALIWTLCALFFSWMMIRLKNITLSSIAGFLQSLFFPKTLKKIAVISGILFIFFNGLSFGKRFFSPSKSPSVLLIVVDALRADHLGCYGYDRPTSPFLDHWAEESFLFENFYSTSGWTKTSMGSLWTSLYPGKHEAFFFYDRLINKRLTLMELFKNQGYNTLGIQTNPLISTTYNFDQGFSTFLHMPLENAEKVRSAFFQWIDGNKRPFFAYLHFMETHLPYDPPGNHYDIFKTDEGPFAEYGKLKSFQLRIRDEMGLSPEEKEYILNLYDAEIHYFDEQFAALITHLKQNRIYDNTLIIVTSDHGEEFWDHGTLEHGHTLYNELLHIPLLIKPPSSHTGKRFQKPGQIIDLFPTILKSSGLRIPEHIDGIDLLSPSPGNRDERTLYFEGLLLGTESKGILHGGWKLIEHTGIKYPESMEYIDDVKEIRPLQERGRFELFYLPEDKNEMNNRIAEVSDSGRQLQALLHMYRSSVASPEAAAVIQNNIRSRKDKIKEELRALGYIK